MRWRSWCKIARDKRTGSYIWRFVKKVPWKLEIKCKGDVYFLPSLFPSSLILTDKNNGLLNGQNLLRVTKVICQLSRNFLKGILLFRSKIAQRQLAQKFKIWFFILKVSNFFLYIQKCTYQEQKRKKNWKFFFLNPSWSCYFESIAQKFNNEFLL